MWNGPYYEKLNAHCREIIFECLNIVEMYGDTYVAVHRDDETECVILVTVLKSFPLVSIIIADELAFKERKDPELLLRLNAMNASSITGWHSVSFGSDGVLYMYRQCIWLSLNLCYEDMFRILKQSISEYKQGKTRIMTSDHPTDPAS